MTDLAADEGSDGRCRTRLEDGQHMPVGAERERHGGAPEALADHLGASGEPLRRPGRHVRELKYRRAIPFVKVGRSLRFDLRDLDRWIEANKTSADVSGG